MAKTAKVTEMRTLRSLAIADLAKSGLDAADAKRLGIEALSASSVEEATRPEGKAQGIRAMAYRIPYFDASGADTGFARLKFLDEVKFKNGKAVKYWQPANTQPRAYLPPFADWREVARDVSRAISITEGEKKAACATKMGHPTVGLGGVWSWQSKKLRMPMIPDLMGIDMVGRPVTLIFDTDPDPKPEVLGALEALGHALEARGAVVGQVRLPALEPGRKVGLDDFLVARGMEALRALPIDGLASGAAMEALNAELAVIEDPPGIFHRASGSLYSMPTQLASTVYASRTFRKANAAGQFVDANAMLEWTRWPRQRRHRRLAYRPGEPEVLPDNSLNTWRGFGTEPRRGDVRPFERLLRHVFGSDGDARSWFLRWLACPVQRPGVKMYTAAVVWSPDQGSGKSLLGYTAGRVYGDNFAVVGEEDLHSQFNGWRAHRQFILGEEITGSDARREANRLKAIVTGERVRVNEKHQRAYEVEDRANYLFTSNAPDAFLIDAHDRRYFVFEAMSKTPPAERLPERWFLEEYDPWYRSEEGAAALHHHLLSVDLGDFHPRARAPATEAKEEMAGVSGTDADFFARALVEAPDRYLRVGDAPVARDLFTYDELVEMLDPGGRRRVGHVALAKALKRLGVRSHLTKVPSGTGGSPQVLRLVAARNRERWDAATHGERAAHYRGEDGSAGKAPKF